MTTKRYHKRTPGQRCSVEGCAEPAAYEVFLYDSYTVPREEFYEQDFTCPFLCNIHKDENEARAKGERRPRAVVRYPYTNSHGAQGYTKYEKLT